MVAINVDKKRSDAERFLVQYPAKFTVVYDEAGNTPAAYGVKGMPSSYLIDARGNVTFVERGFLDEHKAELEKRRRRAARRREELTPLDCSRRFRMRDCRSCCLIALPSSAGRLRNDRTPEAVGKRATSPGPTCSSTTTGSM